MAAQDESGHILDRHAELLRQEIAEPGAIQDASHADDPVRRQPGRLLHHPHHRIQRVGDGDDESLRAMGFDRRADFADDLGVDADEIVAAHAGLPRHPGGDDHHVGALDVPIVVGAGDRGIVALDRGPLDDVERLTLRHPLDDIEQDNIAQLLQAGEQGQRAADLAGANQGDLLACHGHVLIVGRWGETARVLPRNRGTGKAGRRPLSDRSWGGVRW